MVVCDAYLSEARGIIVHKGARERYFKVSFKFWLAHSDQDISLIETYQMVWTEYIVITICNKAEFVAKWRYLAGYYKSCGKQTEITAVSSGFIQRQSSLSWNI